MSEIKKIFKVLIADDEKDITDIMAKRLALEGFEVVKAYDGDEAWQKIESQNPDVIVLDLTMPQMDGFQILSKLRQKNTDNRWQPVIIVSGRGELEDIQKGFSLEADHYITKPCSSDDIIKAINLMLKLAPQHKKPNEQ